MRGEKRIELSVATMPPHCGNCHWRVWDEYIECLNPFTIGIEGIAVMFSHYDEEDIEDIAVLLEPQWTETSGEGMDYRHICSEWKAHEGTHGYEYRPAMTEDESKLFHELAIKTITEGHK